MPSLALRSRLPGAVCAAAVAWLAPGPARADGPVDRCVDADTRAQSLRHEGKFGEAREALKACVDATCPALVRDDCSQQLDDLTRAQPTIVFDVKDEAGRDLTRVHVQMDGRPFAERLEGSALAADPGPHTFVFEAPGYVPVTEPIVVREGEKDRRESVELRGVGAPLPAPRPTPESPPPPRPAGAQRVSALVIGGLGVVALAVGGGLAIVAKSKSDDANEVCPGTSCASSQALSMNRAALSAGDAASVFFVGGAAAVAAGVALWLTAPAPRDPSHLALGVGPGAVSLRGTW